MRWQTLLISCVMIATAAGLAPMIWPESSSAAPHRATSLELQHRDRGAGRSGPSSGAAQARLDREVTDLRSEVEALKAQRPTESPKPAPDLEENGDDVAMAIAEDLGDQLRSEPIDRGWNVAMRQHLDGFLGSPDLEGVALAAIDCRSTMCEVQVALADERARARLDMRVTGMLEADAELFVYYADDASLTPTIYLSRGGHRLPYLEL